MTVTRVKRLLTIKDHMEYFALPDYSPPEQLGTKETVDGLAWNKKLSKYKTGDHDPKWVYTYVTDHNGLPFATVIYDRFPKAFVHLLILPMTIDASGPRQFTPKHLGELSKIHNLAYDIADDLKRKYNLPDFLIGYHAVPSMADLHLHVISGDLVSQFMKRKEHFHSFTNPNYLLHPRKIENDLSVHGHVIIDKRDDLKDQLKQNPMECHQCGNCFKTFRELKEHLNEHVYDV